MKRAFLARIAARLFGSTPAGRTEPPLPSPGDSTDDWGVNDIAECICSGGPWTSLITGRAIGNWGPKQGDIIRVTEVMVDGQFTGLMFSRWPKMAFCASHFRKRTPHADEQTAGTCTTISDLMRLPAQPAEAA